MDGGIDTPRSSGLGVIALAAVPFVAAAALGGVLGAGSAGAVFCWLFAVNYVLCLGYFAAPRLRDRQLAGVVARLGALHRFLAATITARSQDELANATMALLQTQWGARNIAIAVQDARGRLHVDGEIALTEHLARLARHLGAAASLPPLLTAADLSRPGRAAADRELAALLDSGACNMALTLRRDTTWSGIVCFTLPTSALDPMNRCLLSLLQSQLGPVSASLATATPEGAQSLALAAPLHDALLPDDRPVTMQGLSICGVSRPATVCGGDVWARHDLGAGRVLIFLGDATGHGPPAAILAATVKGVVDAHALVRRDAVSPQELLARLDGHVRRVGLGRYLLTAVAAVVDRGSEQVVFANAGHRFPYLIATEHDTTVSSLIGAGDLLGGPGPAHVACGRAALRAGARLLFLTDGLADASVAGRNFGDRRIHKLLTLHGRLPADALARRLVDEVLGYLGALPPEDDITVVAVELPPGPPASGGPAEVPAS
jgi:serine phosphatase RsbU (regulator of sigma subunit)